MSFRRDGKRTYDQSKDWGGFIDSHQEAFNALDLPGPIIKTEDAFWDFFELGYYPYYQHHEPIAMISTTDLSTDKRRILLMLAKQHLKDNPVRHFTRPEEVDSYIARKTIALGLLPLDS